MAPVFNGISIAIWSMVAAKAKAGLSAASSGEHKTVKDYLWQAGALMFMVAAASCFNIYSSQMNEFAVATTVETSSKPTL